MRSLAAVALAFTPTAAWNFDAPYNRRTVLAACAPAAAMITSPAAASIPNPLTSLSRLKEATEARRLREAGIEALEDTSAAVEEVRANGDPSPISEAALPTSAGLAKVDAELNVAYSVAEEGDIDQLRLLLRAPIFTSFLGFDLDLNDSSGSSGSDRQVELVMAFPARVRREAAETLGLLNNKFVDFDTSLAAELSTRASGATPCMSATTLTASVAEVKMMSQKFTSLFLVDGCLVCPDNREVPSKEEMELTRLRNLPEARLLRRPDERDEEYARKLGFREGELIGGY